MHKVERLSLSAMPYLQCWQLQRRRVQGCQQGGPGAVIFVEHAPVITLGRAGRRSSLVANEADLQTAGIQLVHSNRGGDTTYHGPGQLVVYPILNLRLLNQGIHEYFRTLEEVTLQTLADFGIRGYRSSLGTGVWVDPVKAVEVESSNSDPGPTEAGDVASCQIPARGPKKPQAASCKIASMGIHVSRWVTSHGVALNVCNSLDAFRYIVPCGLTGVRMTSMSEFVGIPIARAEVEESFWRNLISELDLEEVKAQPNRGERQSALAG